MLTGLFSSVLGIVIGVSFIYFALSIVASSIQELLSAAGHWRHEDLEAGLLAIVGGPLKRALDEHRLIQSLGTHPAYIPARSFSLALFDQFAPVQGGPVTVARLRSELQALLGLTAYLRQKLLSLPDAGSDAEIKQALARLAGLVGNAEEDLLRWMADLPGNLRERVEAWRQEFSRIPEDTRKTAEALLVLIDSGQAAVPLAANVDRVKSWLASFPEDQEKKDLLQQINQTLSLADVREVVAAGLPPGTLRTTVLDWLDNESTALASARASVEKWFDDSMHRVTDSYKRRVQRWLLLIATLIVLVTGADTLRMVNGFRNDLSLRQAVAIAAEQLVTSPVTVTQTTVMLPAEAYANLTNTLAGMQDVLGYGDLVSPKPDGTWAWRVPVYRTANGQQSADIPATLLLLFSKLVGLALSVAAICLGAPFWFDVLSRVANLRSVGLPPASTTPPPNREAAGKT